MITDEKAVYKAKLILAVMGEAESCNFEEKYLIACVGWNRFRHKKLFGNIEDDFEGYSRAIKIDNPEAREAFLDCVYAVSRAEKMELHTIHSNLFFFNLSGKRPSSTYPVFKADLQGLGLKHTFFGINFDD